MKNLKLPTYCSIFNHLWLYFQIKEFVIHYVYKKPGHKKCSAFSPGLFGGILFVFAITDSFCQGILQGNVKNEKGQPIAFANALLLNTTDSPLIKGEVCDDSGRFNLSPIFKGRYLLSAHMLGFQTFFSFPISIEENHKQTIEFILSGEDVLWTNRLSVENSNSQIGFDANLSFITTSRVFRLSYSKNFGRSGIKSVALNPW